MSSPWMVTACAALTLTVAPGLVPDLPHPHPAPDAPVGAPWITVELPANPFDRETRGALFVVHTYHHALPVRTPLTCRLEGLVDGARRSQACELGDVNRAGTFAVRGAVPEQGVWLAVVSAREEHGGVTAVVEFGSNREVGRVQVPTSRIGGAPRPISAREIDALLRARWQAD